MSCTTGQVAPSEPWHERELHQLLWSVRSCSQRRGIPTARQREARLIEPPHWTSSGSGLHRSDPGAPRDSPTRCSGASFTTTQLPQTDQRVKASLLGVYRLRFSGVSSSPSPSHPKGSSFVPWGTPPPSVTFRRIVASLRGPGQSPVLPFACCVGSLRSVGRCGWCPRWCRFRVRGAQWLVCRGCAGCGGMCRLRVSSAQ